MAERKADDVLVTSKGFRFDKAEITYHRDKFLDMFRTAEDEQRPYRDRWLRYYRMYRAYHKTDYVYRVDRMPSIAFSVIMSVLSRLAAERPMIKYVMNKFPMGFDEAVRQVRRDTGAPLYLFERLREQAVSLMDWIGRYQWRAMKADLWMLEGWLYGLVYGTYLFLVTWDKSNNRPALRAMEPFEFFPCPGVTCFDDLPWCFRRTWVTRERLKEMADAGVYPLLPSDVDITSMGSADENLTGKSDAIDITSYLTGTSAQTVEVIEFYSDRHIATILDGQYLARFIHNPFGRIPVIGSRNYSDPGMFWGISEIDMIEQDIRYIADLRAARVQNVQLIQNAMWRLDPMKNADISTLVNAPNQVVIAEDGALERLPMPGIGQDSYNVEDILKRQIVETSGINDYYRGATPERYETATTVQALSQTSNARINLRKINLFNNVFTDLGKLLVRMNQKFLKPLSLNTGDDIIEVDTDMIDMLNTDYDIQIMPGDSRVMQFPWLVQLLQVIGQSPDLQRRVDMSVFLDRIFRSVEIPTFDMIIPNEQVRMDEENLMAMQQAGMQQAAMQQQAPVGVRTMPGQGAAVA